jgi:hypothetical protein
MKKTNQLFALVVIINFVTLSCSAPGKLLAKEGQAIPDNFGKEKTTMLVVKTGNFQVNNALEKAFEKYYTGDYIIIEEAEKNSKKYSDTKKYKYLFNTYSDYQAGKFVTGQGTKLERVPASSNYSFGVTDRSAERKYSISFYGGGYKGLMEAYVKKLEEERKKNGL